MGYNKTQSKPSQENTPPGKPNPDNKTKRQNDYETIRNQILDAGERASPLPQLKQINKRKYLFYLA